MQPSTDASHGDLAQLARLRVAAVSGQLPPDLASWALDRITRTIGRATARHAWVPLVRRAAECMGGTTRAKTTELAEAVTHLQNYPGLIVAAYYHPSDPLHHVQAALRIEPNIPTSPRQLRRLIE